MKKPKKFMVGRSRKSLIPVGAHQLQGGTWYTSGDCGVPEKLLRDKKRYPFLIWSDSEEVKVEKVPKEAKPSETELEKAIKDMSFTDFRNWAKENYNVTGRSTEGIKRDILEGKVEL